MTRNRATTGALGLSASGIVGLLYVLSGAAGLIYQVVWTRDLVLIFGNTSQSVSTIVAAFMAGLGFGGLAGAHLARTTRHPLRLYGGIELGVASLALLLPLSFGVIADTYIHAYTDAAPATLELLRFALAFAVVTPVTFLMGMTLPLLTRYFVRDLADVGPKLGRLYASNTLGATLGTLASGFVLIELLGLNRTAQVAVVLNITAGLVGLMLSRGESTVSIAVPDGLDTSAGSTRLDTGSPRALLLLATFVSGFVALALEILWTREIAEGTGSIIYLFVAILALYLVGITIGSRQYELRSSSARDTVRTLGGLFTGVGIIALLSMAIGSLPSSSIAQAGRTIALLISVLVATALMGYAFPLTGRLITRSASTAGEAAGVLYAANTLGGILGSFAGTFVLAGTLGTPVSILLLGGAQMLMGSALVLVGRRRADRPTAAGRRVPTAVLSLAGLAMLLVAIDPGLARTSTQNSVSDTTVPHRHTEDEIATVDAVGGRPGDRRLYVSGVGMTALTVDTKLMAYLPKAARPQATDFLAICFGMGSTYRSALTLGMNTDAVELSPSVPRDMDIFFPDAFHYLTASRGRVVVADGRNYVRLAVNRYDIIVVDPPPPVESAGTVVLYTREFVDQSKARLKSGGIMMLFMQNAVTTDGFKMHLRTFAASFKHVTVVFTPGANGTYFFGSDAPMNFARPELQRLMSSPEARADLDDSPDRMTGGPAAWAREVTAKIWIEDSQVTAFTGRGPYITDDRPRSEYFFLHRIANRDLTPVSEDRLRGSLGAP